MAIHRFKLLAIAACWLAFAIVTASWVQAQVDVTGALVGNGSYATLGAAFTAINGGAQGGANIAITIVGNTNEGTVTATLNQSAAPWASMTIQPSGGAWTIAGATSAGTPLMNLNGADNVTIDGLNTSGNALTFQNQTISATVGTSTIQFINGATSNTITRCSIQSAFTGAAVNRGGNVVFSTDVTTGIGNDNNTISNNDIGPYLLNLPTQMIFGGGTATTVTNYNSGIVISGNNIHDYFGTTVSSAGMYVIGGNTDWTIQNNRFYQTASRSQSPGFTHSAITLASGNISNTLVSGNTIGYASAAGTGTYTIANTILRFVAINVSAATSVTISGNVITNISITGANSGNGAFAPFSGIFAAATQSTVTGNTIGSSSANGAITYISSASSTSVEVYGIYASAPTVSVINNVVGGFTAGNSSTGAMQIFAISNNALAGSSYTIQNNQIGGTVANSLQNTATHASSRVIGVLANTSSATVTGNNISNLTATAGNGIGTSAAVAGIILNSTSGNHTIAGNTIGSLTMLNTASIADVTGIVFNGSTGTNLVSKNSIHSLVTTGAVGSTIIGCDGTGGVCNYENNMVRLGLDPAGAAITAGCPIYGLRESAATNNFYHNSVYIGGSGVGGNASTSAFQSSVTVNTRNYRNNIFFNARSNGAGTGRHFAIRLMNSPGFTSNSNVLYVNGTGGWLGSYGGVDVVTIAGWNSFSGQDMNSVSADPNYVLPTGTATTGDLHLASPTSAEGNGQVIATVTDDIDGQTRSGLTPTDIGADAGNLTASVDILDPSIAYTPLVQDCSTGDRTFTATIVDGTGVPTTGILMPRVYFRKNANAYVSSQGVLTSGTGNNGTWTFTLSAAAMGGVAVGDLISYFVIAQDAQAIPRIAFNPSGGVATDVNTVSTPPFSPNSYYTGFLFNGTYTVGVGGDFTTLTAAVNAYNSGCITGPSVLSLIDTSYPSETFPISISPNSGGNAVNTLTIKPTLPNTVISGSGTAILHFHGADYIIVDGSIGSTPNNSCPPITTASRDLSLTNTSTAAHSTVIRLFSIGGFGCTNNVIKNCILSNGVDQSTTAVENYDILACGNAVPSFPPADGLGNNNNVFENNLLLKAAWGIFLRGTSFTSNTGNVIRQNVVGPAAFGGTELRRGGIIVQHQNGVVIQANEVRCVGNQFLQAIPGVDHVGIGIGGYDAPIPISTNVTNAIVTHNTVHDIVCEKTFSAAGILLGVNGSVTTNNLIANNMIYNVHANGTSGNQGIGIGLINGNGDKVVHNTVRMECVDRDPGASTGTTESDIGVRIVSPSNLTFKDNLIYMDEASSNAARKNFAVVTPTPLSVSWGSGGSNYNDYSVNVGSSQNALFGLGLTGLITEVPTLAAWKTTFTPNQDANSQTIVPVFTSATDLHIVASLVPSLDNLGGPIAGVTTDYDCEPRSVTTPDIGADEFAIVAPIITYVPLSSSCSTGDRSFTAAIIHPAGVPTNGPLQPRVYYKKNAGAFVSSQGVFTSGSGTNGTWTFTLSAANMGGLVGGDVITYFVVAQDTLPSPNVGSSPVIGLVATSVNNIVTPPNSPFTTTVGINLSGTYTVGTSGNFATLTAAVNAYNSACLTGPVVFSLTDATYPSETYPITLQANAMASVTHTLTVKPAPGVSPTFTGTGNLIVLSGADYVTIDGSNGTVANSICPRDTATRNLTLNGTGSVTAQVALVTTPAGDPATHNRVMNCTMTGNGYSVHIGGPTIGQGSGANGNSFNEIVNNAMDRRLFASGTILVKNLNNVYSLNVMNQMLEVLYEDAPVLHANRLGNRSATGDVVAMSLGFPSGLLSNTSATGQEVTNASVMYNKIDFVESTNRLSACGIGLAATSTGTTTIANNIISRIASDPIGPDIAAGILWGGGAGTLQVWYNTVSMKNPNGSTLGSTQSIMALGVNGSSPNLDVRNNILHGNSPFAPNTNSINLGYAGTPGNYANLSSNYNDLTTTSSVTGRTVSLSTTGTNWATLAAWQAETGRDANSIRVIPNFASATDFHLLAGSNPNLVDRGIPITVTTDFDCEARDPSTPDMGADETAGCTIAEAGTVSGPSFLCGSGAVTLTATGYAQGLGNYAWQSSPAGANVWTNTGGTNPATYTTGVITASTDFRLRASCPTNGAVDSSNVLTVTVNPTTSPTVSILGIPGGTLCPGTTVAFTATATLAGTAPTYQWQVNSTNVGTNSSTYTSATLVNGDQVTCMVTSNAPCSVPNTVTSTPIVMNFTDAVAPIAVCQDITVALDAMGNGTAGGASANNGSSDNCTLPGSLTFSIANSAFTCSGLGSHPRTLTVTDLSGNTATCGLTVTVVDAIAPNAICQNVTVALDITGNATLSTAQVTNGSTDNCTAGNALALALSGSSFTCAQIGSNTRTLTVTDGQGNSSTCTATVQVIDNLPPTATCQNITVGLNGAGFAGVTASMVTNTASDNCTPPNALSMAVSPTDFSCGNLGNNTATLVVTDQQGNSTSCTSTVNVVDLVAPLAQCQNVTVTLDPMGNGSLTAAAVNDGSLDNCSLTTTLSTTTFQCSHVGNNLVTLTVADGSGNSAQCNAIVAVLDTFAPVALCQNITVALGTNGNVVIGANAVDNGSSDACGIASMGIDQHFFDCGDQGPNPVVLTVVDSSGNTDTCTATVTVPSLGTSISVAADVQDCGYHISCFGANDGAATASGAGSCPPITYLWSTGAFTPTATGLAAGTYTVTVTDGSGAMVVDTVTLVEPPQLQATVGTVQPSCAGNPTGSADITVTGGNSCQAYSYLWSNGATTEDLSAVAPGTYQVVITDVQGCNAIQAVSIGSLPAPMPTFTQAGHQLVASQSWPAYQWLLNGFPLTGADASVYDILVQGTYSLQVTDSNGCIGISTTYVVVGIEEALEGWSVFPNPARNRCALQCPTPAAAGMTVRMTDVLGRVLLEQAIPESETVVEIDLRKCAAGLYWLEAASAAGQRKSFRLVVQ